MSKGPGKWQRAILAQLAGGPAFYLREMLLWHCTKAQYNALLRAAIRLEADGKINIARFLWGATSGHGKTIVHRIGTEFHGKDRRTLPELPRDKWW
jgi:hypothetical protein